MNDDIFEELGDAELAIATGGCQRGDSAWSRPQREPVDETSLGDPESPGSPGPSESAFATRRRPSAFDANDRT